MSCCIVTIDLDWSCEASIEQTLDFFHTKHIPVTVFTTHHSKTKLKNALQAEDIKVLLIHPMHFVLNTPHFNYMYEIKQSMSRSQWTHRTGQQLNALRWKGDGIRNLIIDVINHTDAFSSLRYFLKN